jgi:hypothetical protein
VVAGRLVPCLSLAFSLRWLRKTVIVPIVQAHGETAMVPGAGKAGDAGINAQKGVARSRFELLSRDPESRMIDRYTTGLCASYFLPLLIN